jgi:hypothetical protein
MRHKLFRRLWIACAVGLFLAGWLILIATAHAQRRGDHSFGRPTVGGRCGDA